MDDPAPTHLQADPSRQGPVAPPSVQGAAGSGQPSAPESRRQNISAHTSGASHRRHEAAATGDRARDEDLGARSVCGPVTGEAAGGMRERDGRPPRHQQPRHSPPPSISWRDPGGGEVRRSASVSRRSDPRLSGVRTRTEALAMANALLEYPPPLGTPKYDMLRARVASLLEFTHR